MSDPRSPMDYSPPGPSVHGLLQARILAWVTISFSRGSSQPGDQTLVSSAADGLLHRRQILYLLSQQGSPYWPWVQLFTLPGTFDTILFESISPRNVYTELETIWTSVNWDIMQSFVIWGLLEEHQSELHQAEFKRNTICTLLKS